MFIICIRLNRSMVYALPPGGSHELGLEDGLDCTGRGSSEAEAATSTFRSA